ncbi:MAG: efflux RND transporter periplasmic adaptor subunit [Methylobacillus sp.]|jgi:RND family efflux transporter MFP subunit|nr:efflux RND transporter periplasmic adaptor subunit [Methylobacillus sp.]
MSTDRSQNQARRVLRIGGIIALAVAAVVVVTGIVARAQNDKKLEAWTEAQALPNVSVVTPASSGEASSIALPARFEAYSKAPIYARISGYLKKWYVDIGTEVRAGQMLAEIETPDLDQQLLQAQADLATAKANETLARTTSERWSALLGSGAVSPQEVDEKKGEYDARHAMTNAAQANLNRLLAMRGFARIVSPFDGTITARNTDVGALISEGSNGGPALFEVSDMRKLRLFVNVPQNYVGSIKSGTTASITVPEHPDKIYTATVESTAKAVNAESDAMRVQLFVDNSDHQLLPGGYANVSFNLPSAVVTLSIPSSALIFDKSGLRVATVDANDKVHLKPVTLARDMGKTVEVSAGLTAADNVVENPPDGVIEGQLVHVADGGKSTQPENRK